MTCVSPHQERAGLQEEEAEESDDSFMDTPPNEGEDGDGDGEGEGEQRRRCIQQ